MARSREVAGKKLFSFYLRPDSHRRLKIAAATVGKSMSVLLERLLEEHVPTRVELTGVFRKAEPRRD
jgi:predicted HicB family RNase H-like nuclease